MYNFDSIRTLILFVSLVSSVQCKGILYPRESESREVKSLDGIWAFRKDGGNGAPVRGFEEEWFTKPLFMTGNVELMPVPSSYNDITEDKDLRDHIGWVWYQTTFWAPERWKETQRNLFLRFGSANYYAIVWVNGQFVMNHTGGHLPFLGDVTQLTATGENLLVVALNNTLTDLTVPQGQLHYENDPTRYPKGFTSQTYNFDYFHYAGIHRPVYLYTTPRFYIDDVTISTAYLNNDEPIGVVNYFVDFVSGFPANSVYGNFSITCSVAVRDEEGRKIAFTNECAGVLEIPGVHRWWPHTHAPAEEKAGYLYTLEVHLYNAAYSTEEDVYRLKFGIRTIEYSPTDFKINGKPFYFRGFGRHEDYNIRGRGVDWPTLIKDHNLILWSGANSYRTSHYPYAEEILDLTDRLGIVVIDESPAIGLSGFGDALLKNHADVMTELVNRDKNRASVIMWSIGNEPKSLQPPSTLYFEKIIALTKQIDPGLRPCTIVLSQGFPANKGPTGMDIVSINRYFAWYGDTGRPEVIKYQIPTEVKSWFTHYKRPVLITEYGAGSIAGMHTNPSFVWTEDYQVDYLTEHFKAFDSLRDQFTYFIGEMVWNFADFATPPETFRPWGCMKGVFTRDRQPKAAAHILRWRYWTLANETETCAHQMPSNLRRYRW